MSERQWRYMVEQARYGESVKRASPDEKGIVFAADRIAQLEAELRQREWQPIETLTGNGSFDIWSASLGRITDCGLGISTYGREQGICYQCGNDSDGAVFDVIKDATHWMPLPTAPAGGEDVK